MTKYPAENVVVGTRAIVHVNLPKQVFSVIDPKTHHVIAHVEDISLADMAFRVRPACMDGIKKSGVRAVCAYAIGTVVAVNSGVAPSGTKVTFNPHRSRVFHLAQSVGTDAPVQQVDGASLAHFIGLKVYVPESASILLPSGV